MHKSCHGGDIYAAADLLNCKPRHIIDHSASTVPFALPLWLRFALPFYNISSYPDPSYNRLVTALSSLHCVPSDYVLPGNGASELITWCGKSALSCGISLILQPAYSDYERALRLWGCSYKNYYLPLHWSSPVLNLDFALPHADVIWLTNPHNPTGRLLLLEDIRQLASSFRLIIIDESFLPFVHSGETLSAIPLVLQHPNIIVLRSLTKVFGIAGLRIGYAVAHPDRLRQWNTWRDPWPLNTFAHHVAASLLAHPANYHNWVSSLQAWTLREGRRFCDAFSNLQGIEYMPSAANFCLIRGYSSLLPLRNFLLHRHRILLRDCSSFCGLDDTWIRLSYKTSSLNAKLINLIGSYS